MSGILWSPSLKALLFWEQEWATWDPWLVAGGLPASWLTTSMETSPECAFCILSQLCMREWGWATNAEVVWVCEASVLWLNASQGRFSYLQTSEAVPPPVTGKEAGQWLCTNPFPQTWQGVRDWRFCVFVGAMRVCMRRLNRETTSAVAESRLLQGGWSRSRKRVAGKQGSLQAVEYKRLRNSRSGCRLKRPLR